MLCMLSCTGFVHVPCHSTVLLVYYVNGGVLVDAKDNGPWVLGTSLYLLTPDQHVAGPTPHLPPLLLPQCSSYPLAIPKPILCPRILRPVAFLEVSHYYHLRFIFNFSFLEAYLSAMRTAQGFSILMKGRKERGKEEGREQINSR